MIRLIVSDITAGDHAQTVKNAISSGYGSDISEQIEIVASNLSTALAYADSIGAVAVVRSTTGISSLQELAQNYYPDIQVFMPLGSNSYIELTGELDVIVSSGAGDTENKNNTGYGGGLEFWDNDLETTISDDFSSYSNGVVAGKILKIKDTLNCTWWEARYRARMTADRNESNRPAETVWHKYNGYGKINVTNAIAYSETIITDPNLNTPIPEAEGEQLEEITEPETETITQNIIIMQNFFIDIAKENIDNIIRLFRGDTHTINVYVKNNGEILDLTGYTAVLTAKENLTDTEFAIQLIGTLDADNGQITFTFTSADTAELDAGEYYYDVQISGTYTYTLLRDTLDLKGDVTTNDYFYLGHERGPIKATEDGKLKITESINLI